MWDGGSTSEWRVPNRASPAAASESIERMSVVVVTRSHRSALRLTADPQDRPVVLRQSPSAH
jgi:hypothetical protein